MSKRHTICLYVPKALHREAKIFAAKHDTTLSAMLERGLRLVMEREDEIPPKVEGEEIE